MTDAGATDGGADWRDALSAGHVPIELLVADEDGGRPGVEPGTRIDVSVGGEMYPTARIEDGRYIAWWFDADAPAPTDPATTEWVAAPTRFIAAATLRELWEDPATFDELASRTGDEAEA